MIATLITLALGAAAGVAAVLLLWFWQASRKPGALAPLMERIEPFLDLLDARYLPLLFVNAPQAYTVYAWLLHEGTPGPIATIGGIGFEFVAVGAIAWAVRGAGWEAARATAVTALAFSVAVAVVHYYPSSGTLAFLHAGYPLVGYAYVVMMHTPNRTGAPKLPMRVRLMRWWSGDSPAPVAPAPALLPTDAPTMPALAASMHAYACKKCGGAVKSAGAASASARWGCEACKVSSVVSVAQEA